MSKREQLNLLLPKPHQLQAKILENKARFRVVVCGRRFGKTLLGEHAILTRAIRDHQTCWWLAPTYDMADHVWRELKTAVQDVPGVQISQTDLRMDFPGGGSLAIHSTHTPDHLRGAGLDFVVLDEAAFMSPDIWPQIVRPMLVERQGCALFLSSPNGKNWFHNLFLLGQKPAPTPHEDLSVGTRHVVSSDVDDLSVGAQPTVPSEQLPPSFTGEGCGGGSDTLDNDLSVGAQHVVPSSESLGVLAVQPNLNPDTPNPWHSFHFSTSANPLIPPEELEAVRLETPERVWLEEYEAEFTDDAGQVFRGIREAATAPLNAEPIPDTRYAVGLDWGRENDYTAVVVIDTERRTIVALDHFNQVSWSLQRGRLKAICDRWQPVVIYAESNSIGSPNIEALQAEGLPVRPFNTTSTTKPPLIEALSLAIERRDIALLPDENLLNELAAYGMERLPAGGYRYSAPPGFHDDLVIAAALAWYAAHHSSLPISFA